MTPMWNWTSRRQKGTYNLSAAGLSGAQQTRAASTNQMQQLARAVEVNIPANNSESTVHAVIARGPAFKPRLSTDHA